MFSLVLACLSCDVCGDGREEAAEKGGKEAGHTLKWTCTVVILKILESVHLMHIIR